MIRWIIRENVTGLSAEVRFREHKAYGDLDSSAGQLTKPGGYEAHVCYIGRFNKPVENPQESRFTASSEGAMSTPFGFPVVYNLAWRRYIL